MLVVDGKNSDAIRGVDVGKRHVEAGIKIGASISVLGSISFNVDGDMIL